MSPRSIRRLHLSIWFVIVLLFTTPSARLNAAPPHPAGGDDPWLVQFGTGGDDVAEAIVLTPAGQLVVAGRTEGMLDGDTVSDTVGETAAWVAVYDLAGNRQWLKQFGGSQIERIVAAGAGPDGQVFVTGISEGGLFSGDPSCSGESGGSEDEDVAGSYLLALNTEGEPLWHCFSPGLRFSALAVDDLGVYAAGGLLESTIERGEIPQHPANIFAFDLDGGRRWQSDIGDDGFWLASTAAVSDGKLFVGGIGLRPPFSQPQRVLWGAQLDQEGKVIGQDEIKVSAPEYAAAPTGSAFDSEGSPIMVGIAFEALSDEPRPIGWLAQMVSSLNGQSYWTLREFRTGADAEIVYGMAVKGPDRYWLSGTQAMFDGNDRRIPQTEDVWLAEAGSQGAVSWITAFGTPAVDSVTAPVADPDGSLYVAGSTEGDFGGANAGGADVWIMKVPFNEIGIPQLAPELPRKSVQPPSGETPAGVTPLSEYSSLAGAIVFAADPEAQGPMHGSLTPTHQLYAIQPDGSGLAQITREGIFPWQTAAAAPDGKQIALSSFDASPIRFIDPTGRILDEVKHPGKRAHALEWSPSGDAVLFVVVDDLDDGREDQDLWRLSVSGYEWTQITSDDAVKEWDASWSPDGKRIVTERDTQLWMMDADGGNAQQLGDQVVRFVAWSPDGQTIAYQSLVAPDQAEAWDIWAMDADGANPRNLTDDPDWYEENPSWSPDSRYLIYNASSTADGPSAIWILDMESGGKRILIDKGDNVQPLWVPGAVSLASEAAAGAPAGGEAQGPTGRLALQTAGFILDGSLWTIQADGSGLRRLTDPEQDGRVSAFAWADDGSALAFIAQKEGAPSALLRMDMPDTAGTRVVAGTVTNTLTNTVSTVVTDGVPGFAAGTVDTILDEVKEGKLAWSADKIVLLSREPAPAQDADYVYESELTIIDLAADPPSQTSVRGGWQTLASEAGPYSYVTISPDGQWIYFVDANVQGLAKMDGTAADLGRGRNNWGIFGQWKSNPTVLTFTRYDSQRDPDVQHAYQLAPETGEVSVLFDAPAGYIHFSSDGNWAAIADPNLKLLNAEDPQPRSLSSVQAVDPRWSPWGDVILYRRTVNDPEIIGESRLASDWKAVAYDVITVDGKDQQLLLPNDVEDLAWRPLTEAEAALYQVPTRESVAALPVSPAASEAAGAETAGDDTVPGGSEAQAAGIGVVTSDPLNFRAGPSTDATVLDQLTEGSQVEILERSPDGQWLRVRIPRGLEGWVSAKFVAPAGEGSATNALAAAPNCSIRADEQLAARWSEASLGCATEPAAHVWAAWQPFEDGAMLWRDDTKQIYILYAGGTWRATADTWDGSGLQGKRGNPPASLQAPERGIGYAWESDDTVFDRLGWATDQERGTCVLVQKFEGGEVLRSTGSGCGNGLYSHGQEPGFALQYLVLLIEKTAR